MNSPDDTSAGDFKPNSDIGSDSSSKSGGSGDRSSALAAADAIFAKATKPKVEEKPAMALDPEMQSKYTPEERAKRAEERKAARRKESQQVTPSSGGEMRWYVVHAYSGFELKAKQALEERVRQLNVSNLFGQVLVPQETVVELVKGQKKTTNRKFYPGYILVQMVLNEDTWHIVKDTPKITGFVGDATDPAPLADEEVAKVVTQVEEGAASPRARMNFEQGEMVKVVDGPFTDFNGTIEEVRPEKGKVKVLISIFGRATPVELDFVQIEKIQ